VPVFIRRPDIRAGTGEANKDCYGPKHDFHDRRKWRWHLGAYPVVRKSEKKHCDQYRTTH
jgi:hypothetical protein